MKSWSLHVGASLAEIGALAEAAAARNRAWQWRGADSGLDVLKGDATCGNEGWLQFARARASRRERTAAAAAALQLTKGINNKNEIAYSVMTGGNSSRTTAGAPNWDE